MWLVSFYKKHKISSLKKEVFFHFHFAITTDLLTLPLDAGESLIQSIKLILPMISHEEVSQLFHYIVMQSYLGLSPLETLQKYPSEDPWVNKWIHTLILSYTHGTPLVYHLHDLSRTLLNSIQSDLEAEASKLSIKMLFPMILFIFPSLVIIFCGSIINDFLNIFY